jgi:hypothetical protein
MFAVHVTPGGSVDAFDLMTLATFAAERLGLPNWYFVDRDTFFSEDEVAAFMQSPQSYYIDSLGILRLDYQDSLNDVNTAPFDVMGTSFNYGTQDTV